MLVVASASEANAVTPTVPVAFSSIALAVALLSVGAVTSNSFTSLIATVNWDTAEEPSVEAALTKRVCEAPSVSRSSAVPSETTPVELSIENGPL